MHHQHAIKANGSSTTEVRRVVTASDASAKHRRPAMARRHTPASAQKLGRSQRERERERECDGLDSWHDDERESFPQFCMTCEKQFMPHDDKFLYCSETCRRIDQSSTPRNAASTQLRTSISGAYGLHQAGFLAEPRDIVPQATPSRPTSMHLSNSPPASPGSHYHHGHYSSAISALRSLNLGPSSPPSPTGSGIWPFCRSTAATSPANSYSRPCLSSSSSSTAAALEQPNRRHSSIYSYNSSTYSYDSGYAVLDRPLPSRHPSAYSRPKSIELVTPVIGR
ncbi:hypothetical protein CDD82_7382 [Ophiocordyceps australis]|uniref:Life-span regulatory factor domain-containing protein n=1 Tax=Ophiocordyceps australis TaxID=1399860 RepID=A0A2C5YR88_9HYPO|nr:hypothetical protein CDD82_7382 [Ophiocordyceps australis]